MSEFADEVAVEIRRNGNGSVLAYTDRDRAEEVFDNHREVLRSLYDLVDRRYGSNGETVARLEVVDDGLGEILVRDEFVREIGAEHALALADDMRYHAEGRELVPDGGRVQDDGEIEHGSTEYWRREAEESDSHEWCEDCEKSYFAHFDICPHCERRVATDGGRDQSGNGPDHSDDDLARVADALELQNALLLRLVQDQRREAAREHPDPDHTGPSDRATATDIVDSYGELYGGSILGWEFDPIDERVDDMGDSR